MSQNLGKQEIDSPDTRPARPESRLRSNAQAQNRAPGRPAAVSGGECRGTGPQPAAPVRAGRQRPHRVHRAQRRQDGPLLGRHRDHRGDEHPFGPRPPVVRRSHALCRGAGHIAAVLCRAVEQHRLPHVRSGRGAGRRAGAGRQPLQGPRVVGQPILRLLEAGLPRHRQVGGGHAAEHRGPRRAHAPARRVLPAAGGKRALAVELPAHQPRGAARDSGDQCREPRAGHVAAGRGHAQVRRSPQGQPDRHHCVRGRPQSRDDARQGHLSERHLPADPVFADHRQGARDPAADGAAVDQQVLHPRPHAGEEPDQVPRRPGLHRLHHLVGEPGLVPLAQVLRGLHAGGHPHGCRRGEARDGRR